MSGQKKFSAVVKRKKILIHSIVFSPDAVSTAYLYNDIARRFKQEGYDVAVLTTTPHYNKVDHELKEQVLTKHWGGLYYTSDFEGIPVTHIYQKKSTNVFLRLLGFVYWHIMSFILGLFERRVSVILSPSPPLTIGFVNILLGKLKGCKVIYNVQEIYPDILVDHTNLRSKPIIYILKQLERFVYNRSSAVTTIDQVFYDTISTRFDQPEKLHIIPNFVDTSLYRPLPKSEINLDSTLFPDDNRLKVMYAGNIGHAQDWVPLIEVAKRLLGKPVVFFVIGEGVLKEKLESDVQGYGLSNVIILPYQPRALMPQLLAYADLQFIFMTKGMEGSGFPSKVYTIMASAKPLIVLSGKKTPIYELLNVIDCAYLIDEANLKEKLDKLEHLLCCSDENDRRIKGERGLQTIKKSYTKEVVINSYVSLIDSLIKLD